MENNAEIEDRALRNEETKEIMTIEVQESSRNPEGEESRSLTEQLKDEKGLTPKQNAFLEAFFGPANCDANIAKQMAGYSSKSRANDIVRPLRKHIEEGIQDKLAEGAAQGVGALVNVLNDPTKPGQKERIQAANSLLDRFGVTKEAAAQTNVKVQVTPVVYLPEKKEVELDKEDFVDITPE